MKAFLLLMFIVTHTSASEYDQEYPSDSYLDSFQLETDLFRSKADGPVCDFNLSTPEEEIERKVNKTWYQAGIVCGTKWCGSGNIASNNTDLGRFKKLDACCRDHDHCPDVIKAYETKYNLTNDSKFTRLNCGCDEQFRLCLKGIKPAKLLEKIVKGTVGFVYFDVYNAKCYKKDHPWICCEKFNFFKTKCKRYRLNSTEPEIYQWWSTKSYKDAREFSEDRKTYFGKTPKLPPKC